MAKYVSLEDVAKMALSMMSISNTEWVQALQGLPIIDIVRCTECKKNGTEECPMKDWNYTWGEYEFFNDADDFCSFGINKNDE